MHISPLSIICIGILMLFGLIIGHVLLTNSIARRMGGLVTTRFPHLFIYCELEDNAISLHPAVRRYAHCLSGCITPLMLTLWLAMFTGSKWSLLALSPILILFPLSLYFYKKIPAALAASQTSPPSDTKKG